MSSNTVRRISGRARVVLANDYVRTVELAKLVGLTSSGVRYWILKVGGREEVKNGQRWVDRNTAYKVLNAREYDGCVLKPEKW